MSLYNKAGSVSEAVLVRQNRNGDLLIPTTAAQSSFGTLIPSSTTADVGAVATPWQNGYFSGQVRADSFVGSSLTVTTLNATNLVGAIVPSADFLPVANNTYNIGSSTNHWKDIYWSGVGYGGGLNLGAQAVTQDIVPTTTSTYNIGSNGVRYQNLYLNGAVNAATGAFTGALSAQTVAQLFPALTTGTNNLAIGASAGVAVTSGSSNVSYGPSAGTSVSTASNCTAIGANALGSATANGDNVAIGAAAGQYVTSLMNVYVGSQAGKGVVGTSTGQFNVGIGYSALTAITTGTDNVMIGMTAGSAITAANESVGVGFNTLAALTSGGSCTAIGASALEQYTGTGSNIAIGWRAARCLTTGIQNTYIGTSCGTGVVGTNTSTLNVGIGYNCLTAVTTAQKNVMVGWSAGAATTIATEQVAIGYNALSTQTGAGSACTAVGAYALEQYNALYAVTAIGWKAGRFCAGDNNTFVGVNAGAGAVSTNVGASNTAVGSGALAAMTGATNNCVVGWSAAGALTSGSYNVVIGAEALAAATSSSNNVGIGNFALSALTTNGDNIAIGANAAQYLDAVQNVYIGSAAGKGVNGSNTSTLNVGIGYNCLTGLTSGQKLVMIGWSAGAATTTATEQVAIGYNALSTHTGTGNACTAVGAYALEQFNTTTGITAVGWKAGRFCTGGNNTFLGVSAGVGALSTNTGTQNVGVGSAALSSMTTALSNTALGYNAGSAVTSGARNILIGDSAGGSLVSGSDNVIVGQNTTLANATTGAQNVIVGGNNATTATTSNAAIVGYGNSIGHSACIVLGSGITTAAANRLYIGSGTQSMGTATTVGAAGGGTALPATPTTYLIAYVNGTQYKIPLYNP